MCSSLHQLYLAAGDAALRGRSMQLTSQAACSVHSLLEGIAGVSPLLLGQNTENENILRSCPFCGAVDSYNPSFSTAERLDGVVRHFVECSECGASGPLHSTKDEAETAWNKRPALDTETYRLIVDTIDFINDEYASEQASALDGDPIERGRARNIRDRLCYWIGIQDARRHGKRTE